MGSHPLNLALRFFLEVAALVAAGMWGWRQSDSWLRFLLAFGVPILLMVIWATFAVPKDPSRSGSAPVPIPGALRLLLELAIFWFAAWALYNIKLAGAATTLAIVVVVHYVLSYDRILWLLGR